MAIHNDIGEKGEDLAVLYLKNKGYVIIERNWRYSRAEIDIIAKKGSVLVFVEVKTRSNDHFGQPEDSITPRKERLIIDASSAYMEQKGHDWEIRFDIISVLLYSESRQEIKHFVDVFF